VTASKRVAIVQSNYIPWKGYFDLIGLVDEFILFDDRQYTRRDWRNRNLVKTPRGPEWLTIAVQVKGRYLQRIDEVQVAEADWAEAHWSTIALNYSHAPCFAELRGEVDRAYRAAAQQQRLSAINRLFIETVCGVLGIRTKISWSTDYSATGTKTDRLIDLCRQAGATDYLSGPAARAYVDDAAFERAGIRLAYMDYSGYPEYPQLFPPFDHHVSILDLLFNVGFESPRFMKFAGARQTLVG
jgi:hypothetical protein